MSIFSSKAKQDKHIRSIASAAQRVHGKITAKRRAMDQAGLVDDPLYVLIGENHCSIEHGLFLLKLSTMLSSAHLFSPMIYSFEHSHNMYLQANTMKAKPLPLKQAGQQNLRTYIDKAYFMHAPYIREVLYSALWEQSKVSPISFLFADAARDQQGIRFDCKNLSTLASMRACGYKDSYYLIYHQPGMFIRNHHMHKKLTRATNEMSSRIAIQFCGSNHLAGNNDNFPFDESLSSIFTKNNQHFLSIFPCQTALNKADILPKIEADNFHVLPDFKAALSAHFPNEPSEAARIGVDISDLQKDYDYTAPKIDSMGLSHYKIPYK